jgi:hypothetical protein
VVCVLALTYNMFKKDLNSHDSYYLNLLFLIKCKGKGKAFLSFLLNSS